MKNLIKPADEILKSLTADSPDWEKLAAYNELLRLRNCRDYFAPLLARYQVTNDAQGIRMMSRAVAECDAAIAEVQAKLMECGVIQGATAPEAADTRTENQRLAEYYGSMAQSDALADFSGLLAMRGYEEVSASHSAYSNAKLAAHHARLHLAQVAA